MKRDPSLRGLSREHNEGLIQARRLKQAVHFPAEVQRAVIRSYIWFADRELHSHMLVEEELLRACRMALEGEVSQGTLQQAAVQLGEYEYAILEEHEKLKFYRDRMLHVIRSRDPESLNDMQYCLKGAGQLLHDHIRFEERVVFPFLEDEIGQTRLADFTRNAEVSAGSQAQLLLNAPSVSCFVDAPDASAAHEGEPWSWGGSDISASLQSWRNGRKREAHTRHDSDSLLIGIAGQGKAMVGVDEIDVRAGTAVAIPRGIMREITSSDKGFSFLEVRRATPTAGIRVLALALIFRGDEILVQVGFDRVTGREFFRPVGGQIEFGETGEAALVREFFEELGVEITGVKRWGIFENIFTFNGERGHEICQMFTAEFVESSEYDRNEFLVDCGEHAFKCVWLSLSRFNNGEADLVPSGLLDFLKSRF